MVCPHRVEVVDSYECSCGEKILRVRWAPDGLEDELEKYEHVLEYNPDIIDAWHGLA